MCLALNSEDPGPRPVPREQTYRTLQKLREESSRGRALVLELNEAVVGYALLISFWSNELGGEVCTIDELYVDPTKRRQGHGTKLFEELHTNCELWPSELVALALEVRPGNARAHALYERLGFKGETMLMKRPLARR
jgi:GNAT superfamily N-acetyltransferase